MMRVLMRSAKVQVIPDEFNAAGLIVPDPAINSLPMPLTDLETEGVAWYMAPGPASSISGLGARRRPVGAA
jgi:hypothetical protein